MYYDDPNEFYDLDFAKQKLNKYLKSDKVIWILEYRMYLVNQNWLKEEREYLIPSFENQIKPINKTYYPNILDAILEEEQKGNIIIYRFPNRPKDMPQDNSDLIDKYISFEEQGIANAVSQLLSVYPEFKEVVEERKLKQKLR